MSESAGRSGPREFRARLLEFLRERREDGNSYVKSNLVSDRLDVGPRKAGKNLAMLCDRGYLEIWRDASSYKLYRITDQVFEEGGADV